MASLQIRQLPDEVYEALTYRAERAGRSLAQQAVAELRAVPELEARARRTRTIEELRERIRRQGPIEVPVAPEVLIREDRDR
jgi:plasmid stability protein